MPSASPSGANVKKNAFLEKLTPEQRSTRALEVLEEQVEKNSQMFMLACVIVDRLRPAVNDEACDAAGAYHLAAILEDMLGAPSHSHSLRDYLEAGIA